MMTCYRTTLMSTTTAPIDDHTNDDAPNVVAGTTRQKRKIDLDSKTVRDIDDLLEGYVLAKTGVKAAKIQRLMNHEEEQGLIDVSLGATGGEKDTQGLFATTESEDATAATNALTAAGGDVDARSNEAGSLLRIIDASATQAESTVEQTPAQLQAQMQQMQAQIQIQMTQMMEYVQNGLATQMAAHPEAGQPVHPTPAVETAAVRPDLTHVYVYDLRSSTRKYLPTIDDLLHITDFPPPQVTPPRDLAAATLPRTTPNRRRLAVEPLQDNQVEATYVAKLTEKNGKQSYNMHDVITINEVCARATCVCAYVACGWSHSGVCACVPDLVYSVGDQR